MRIVSTSKATHLLTYLSSYQLELAAVKALPETVEALIENGASCMQPGARVPSQQLVVCMNAL